MEVEGWRGGGGGRKMEVKGWRGEGGGRKMEVEGWRSGGGGRRKRDGKEGGKYKQVISHHTLLYAPPLHAPPPTCCS